MQEQDPNSISQVITYIWVLALSTLGGLVSYFNRLEKKKITHSLLRLVAEMITSSFVGIVTFMLCDAGNFSWQITAAMVAISGHMGTRLVFKFEEMYINVFNMKGK